ncbi:MAG: thioredoxin family protein [Bacteroidota bacterium]
MDVDQNPGLASKYHIQGVPTVIIFKNGQLVWRQSGVASKSQLIDLLKQHI